MVKYQEWTEIAFSVAKERGFQSSRPEASTNKSGGRSFSPGNQNAQAISLFAEIWNDRKSELQSADRTEARQIAEQEVSVS